VSKRAPPVADLILQKLKLLTINNLPVLSCIFYFTYVNGIAFTAANFFLNDFLNGFNSFHPRLKFTMKVEGDILNFLDLSLNKRDGRLIFNWYQRPTFSGRFLNFESQHKRGTIISSIDRILLFHLEFHKENFDFIINILLDNRYSLDLTFFYHQEKIIFQVYHHNFFPLSRFVKSSVFGSVHLSSLPGSWTNCADFNSRDLKDTVTYKE